ncbi:MAG: hypothetical protein M9921_14140 [Fimbriimonadaceae bacterium]|nr:hypothetical protein [Fimbriimonadaceae bacterium]
MEPRRSRKAFYVFVTLLPLFVIAGAYLVLRKTMPHAFADTSNYEILFPRPANWVAVPHAPFTQFLFEHKETRSQIRGASNRIVSDINPTPDLNEDGLAKYYMATTAENQPDWKAERLPDMQSKELRFSAIRRTRGDKIVVTAFTVRGNTTVMVSLAVSEPYLDRYDELLGEFKKFLGDVRLVPNPNES